MPRKPVLSILIASPAWHRALRISLPSRLVYSLLGASVAAFFWSVWIISRQVDYWQKTAENYLLERKSRFYAEELLKAREAVERTREADAELRRLLGLGSRRKILEGGGPTPLDRRILEEAIAGRPPSFSEADFVQQVRWLERQSETLRRQWEDLSKALELERARHRNGPRGWPADGRITSRYGWRIHPITGRRDLHVGLDIAHRVNAPVRATGPGRVLYAGWKPGYGRVVVVDHGYNIQSRYAHLRRIAVRAGSKVTRGQVIGWMGTSGHATGPHVHYEVILEGRPVSPARYLD